MNITIRVLEADELEVALELIGHIFPDADPDISEDDTVLVAEISGRLVGFAHVIEEKDKVILQGLGVEESARGQGIGSALIGKVLEMFCNTDKSIVLKTSLSNPALELYHNYGFGIKKFGHVHVLERKREN